MTGPTYTDGMRRLGTLAALLLLSACATGSPGASPSPQASRFQTTDPLPPISVPPGAPTTLPDVRLVAIRADLSNRGTNPDPLTVLSTQSVTFNDGSLGCPQPGVQYTQAQVNGTRVVVEAAGRQFDYRFGAGDIPKLCENGPAATSSSR